MTENNGFRWQAPNHNLPRLGASAPQAAPSGLQTPAPAPLVLDGGSYDYPGSVWAGTPLRGHFQSLRKYLWLIVTLTALMTGLVTLYTLRQPSIYKAEARIQVNLETFNPALGSTKDSSFIVSGSGSDQIYLNTQLQLLTSPELLQSVAQTVRLDKAAGTPTPTPAVSGLLATTPAPPIVDENQRAAKAEMEAERLAPFVLDLQKNLVVKQVKDTRLIDIGFTDIEPRRAAQVVNTLVKAFVDNNLANKTETQTSSSEFLTQRIAELQAKIREGETRLVNYAQQTEGLSPDSTQSQNTVVERLMGLNRTLLEAENARKEAEAARYALAQEGAAQTLTDKNTELTEQLTMRLNGLQQRRAELAVKFTDQYPEVISVNDQIAVVEKQLTKVRQINLTTAKGEADLRYNQAAARERALRADFETQRRATATQNAASINYRIVQQEVEINKSTLNSLLQRSRENDILRASTGNNIRVNYLALVPKKPVGPNRLLSIVLALFVSGLASVGLALALGYLDDSVQTPADVEQALRLPALALIPAVSQFSRRRRLPGWTQTDAADAPSELLLRENAPQSLAESYRQLRTSILLSKAGRAPKTILVTSSAPAEGKTTTSINVAVSLAQTGAKVLIIDADLRRPRLHGLFNFENHLGLSNLLSGSPTPGEIASSVNCHLESGLHVLTSGPVPPNPAELLGSLEMRDLLEQLGACFSHVVIDSPPIASFTDSALLGTMVDGVLVVVQSGKVSRSLVQRACRSLQDVGAKIIGVVLNNVTNKGNMGDYYNYYQDAYYHSEPDPLAAGASANGHKNRVLELD